MASELFSNRFAPQGRAEKNQIVDQYGTPFRNGNGSATSRFARDLNLGPESGFAVPHVLTFSSILGSAFRNYYHGQYDEATRFSREDALAMRNDAYIMSLVDERKRRVVTLENHIEVDNPRDAWEKAVKDGMTQLWRSIPNHMDLNNSGMEALWFGRAGDQFDWWFPPEGIALPAMPRSTSGGGLPTISMAANQDQRERRRAIVMRGHLPTEGDKIDYDYDGNPYVLITAMAANRLFQQGADVRQYDGKGWRQWSPDNDIVPKIKAEHADIGYTTIGGRALYLKGSWRTRWRIHKHMVLDASFFEPWKAGAVHGVGIRSVIFWYWWLRQEFLANVTDWCARTGLGVKLWYYDLGNDASKRAVQQAAQDQTDRVNIMIPREPGTDNKALDIVETSGTGADLLLRIVKHIEDYLERYIVGQSMSGGSDDMSAGFGDKGRSDYAKNTQYQITKFDAAKFADTNTNDILKVMLRWTYPEFADMPIRLVYDVDDPDVGKWIEGAKAFIDMGGKIVADEARSRLGLSAPREGDETVGGMEALQAQQATSGHVKPPEGLAPAGNASSPPQAPSAEPSVKDHYQAANLQLAPQPVNVTINEREHTPATIIIQPPNPVAATAVPIRYKEAEIVDRVKDILLRYRNVGDVKARADAVEAVERLPASELLAGVLYQTASSHANPVERMKQAGEVLDRLISEEREAEQSEKQRMEQAAQADLDRNRREADEKHRYEMARKQEALEHERAVRVQERESTEKLILQELPTMIQRLIPEPVDLERFAKALKEPVVNVEVPKQEIDLEKLATILRESMPAPIDYDKLAKAIRGDGRKVTIKGPGGKEFTAEVK